MLGPNRSRITFWYWAVVKRGKAGSEGAKGATLTAAPPVLPALPPTAVLALPPVVAGCSALLLEAPSIVPVQPAAPHAPVSKRVQIARATIGFWGANMRG